LKNKENGVELKPIEMDSGALRQKLAENRKKLEDMALHMVQKNEELGKLKLEIEQLTRLYPENKPGVENLK